MRTIALAGCIFALACSDSSGDGGGVSSTDTSTTTPDDDDATATAADDTPADDDDSTVTPGTSTSTSGDTTASGTTAVDSTGDGSSTGGDRECAGEFPAMWPDGTDCSEPEITVHVYDEDTYILRQSLCTSFEGPFLYLLFGQDRVLLEDTGDGGIALADAVYGIIDDWLVDNGRESIELVVAHSHSHGDHVAGDSQFAGMPNTTVVPLTVSGVADYFGIANWPDDVVEFDLGGRVLDVVPIPGHHTAHIALFDRNEGLLLTGDTLYPGRLYISDFPDYVDSIHRIVDTIPSDDVCHVLGTHIEMTNMPGVDYEFGADQHPNEHVLELDWAHLLELRDAVDAMANPQIEVHDDFIVYPL